MPYVIKNADGQYLLLRHHRYQNKREWVDELDRATTWEKAGHAKSAASQAYSLKATAIQEVRLMLWGAAIPHKPKRPI